MSRGFGRAAHSRCLTPRKQESFIIAGSQRRRPPVALGSHGASLHREGGHVAADESAGMCKGGRAASCPFPLRGAPAQGRPLAPSLMWQRVGSKCFIQRNRQARCTPKPHPLNPREKASPTEWPAQTSPQSFLLKIYNNICIYSNIMTYTCTHISLHFFPNQVLASGGIHPLTPPLGPWPPASD